MTALAARAADLRRRCMAGARMARGEARLHPEVAGRFLELAELLEAAPSGELLRPDPGDPIRLDEADRALLHDRIAGMALTSPLWRAAEAGSRWSLHDFATDVAALAPPHVSLAALPEHVALNAFDTGGGHPSRLWALLHAEGWELEQFVQEVVRLARGT